MNDSEGFAWLVTVASISGVIGWWMGYHKAVRVCRRIAQSPQLDRVFREDARADASYRESIPTPANKLSWSPRR